MEIHLYRATSCFKPLSFIRFLYKHPNFAKFPAKHVHGGKIAKLTFKYI